MFGEVNLLGNPGCGDETTGQVMLLACRCLYNVVDILQGAQSSCTSWAGQNLGKFTMLGKMLMPFTGIEIPILRIPIGRDDQRAMNPMF